MNIRSTVAVFQFLSIAARAFNTSKHMVMTPKCPPALRTSSISDDDGFITILGFGSLLSERSSRMTFPELENFRLGHVPNYRRVFGHPASIFFQRGIANLATLEMSSLSAEYAKHHSGFVCSVFEVSSSNIMEDGVPSQAFLEREEEFDIVTVPYVESDGTLSEGILCTASTDEKYLKRWGEERFENNYGQYGVSTIWGFAKDSALRPCSIYLRHCVLASKSMGPECHDSFLDDTFLVDRATTLREYLEKNPLVMTTEPPPDMAVRYGG